jgi:DNA-binding NarL/FixJ family response regulator
MTSTPLADHHNLFRSGMVKLIDGVGGFALAAEVDTGGAAVEYVGQYTPDILLLEMVMPDMSGFEVLRRIQHAFENLCGCADKLVHTVNAAARDALRHRCLPR